MNLTNESEYDTLIYKLGVAALEIEKINAEIQSNTAKLEAFQQNYITILKKLNEWKQQ